MGAKHCNPSCQRSSEHRTGLEPASPLYESGVFAARRPVLCFSVGLEGLEPSPAWVRTRDAAANTSVPNCFRVERVFSMVLNRKSYDVFAGALKPSKVGVEGIEPSAHDL